MSARIIDIEELQPIDSLRVNTVSYLEKLNVKEIQDLGKIEAWETPLGIAISEGNNRATILAKKGCTKIKVDFNKFLNVNPGEDYLYDEICKRIESMREQGIYSVYDLLRA